MNGGYNTFYTAPGTLGANTQKWLKELSGGGTQKSVKKVSGGSGAMGHTVMPLQYYDGGDNSGIMTHDSIARGGISDDTFLKSLVGGNKHKKKSDKKKSDKKKSYKKKSDKKKSDKKKSDKKKSDKKKSDKKK